MYSLGSLKVVRGKDREIKGQCPLVLDSVRRGLGQDGDAGFDVRVGVVAINDVFTSRVSSMEKWPRRHELNG